VPVRLPQRYGSIRMIPFSWYLGRPPPRRPARPSTSASPVQTLTIPPTRPPRTGRANPRLEAVTYGSRGAHTKGERINRMHRILRPYPVHPVHPCENAFSGSSYGGVLVGGDSSINPLAYQGLERMG
jgi:hypothetical protein